MKKYILLFLISLLSLSCNAQNNKSKNTEIKESIFVQPKGSWKVNKEFDDKGNLIRYDSIYSWSKNSKLDNFSNVDKDSLLKLFKSRFIKVFSDFKNTGFNDVFSKDSLLRKRFFEDGFFRSDFGRDFMDIDKIRQQMIVMQKEFLEKYQSEFTKPKDEN